MCHPIVDHTPHRPRAARRFAPALAAAAALAWSLALAAPTALAQEETAPAPAPVEIEAAPPAAAPERPVVEAPAGPAESGLADEIAARFEVLPTRDGLLLRPRAAGAGYHAIEVEDGEVAVDGETLAGDELAATLGADAGPVSRLAALGPAAREAFGYGTRPPVEEPPLPGAGEIPPPGALEVDLPEVPEPPVPPEPPEPPQVEVGQRVSITSSVTVEADEVAEVAVAVGGNVQVDGHVEQDAVAVGGSVRVNGRVEGEAVAVGGSVYLGPEAEIDGNVTSVGGRVVREPGARIGGQVSEVSMAGAFFGRDRGDRRHGAPWRSTFDDRLERMGDVFGHAVGLAVLLLLVVLVTLLMRAPVERVAAKSAEDPWRSLIAGFLTELLFFPVLAVIVLILLISVIGIPLLVLVPFVLLLFGIAFLVGIAGVARTVAGLLERRFGWHLHGVFLPALVGLAAIHLWALFGNGLEAIGGPLDLPAALLWVFGLTLQFVAWTIGLGAVLLTRFGAGPRPVPGTLPAPPPGGGPAGGVHPHPPAQHPPAPPVPAGTYVAESPPSQPSRRDSIFEPEPPAPAVAPAEPAPGPVEPEPADSAYEPESTEPGEDRRDR